MIFFFASVSATTHRIVTLGPAVTNQIMLAGKGQEIVGKTSYCDPKAGVPGKTVEVGSLLTLSVESIVALRPTIVFASGLTSPAIQSQLQKIGVRVVVVDDPKSFGHLCQNFATVCRELGATKRGDSILVKVKQDYLRLKSDLVGKKVKKSFVQLGGSPLYTVIKGSLGDELITMIGGVNLFDLTKSGEVSRESVILKNPEQIFISDMGFSTTDEIARWKQCTSLSAVKHNRIYVVDAYAIGSPTPVSFLATVRNIRRQIGFVSAQ